MAKFGQKSGQYAFLGPGKGQGVYKVILMANTEFCQIWPKIWLICIFNLREGLRGLNSNFDVKNEIWPNLAQLWPKIWSICIFRPREGSRGLNSDFDGKNRIWPNLAENGQKYGQYAFLALGRSQGV